MQAKPLKTFQYKNIKKKFALGIPTKLLDFKTINKTELRRQLGFPIDQKIIITAGSDIKYKPICGDSFIDVLLELVDDNTYIYAIGVKKNSKEW